MPRTLVPATLALYSVPLERFPNITLLSMVVTSLSLPPSLNENMTVQKSGGSVELTAIGGWNRGEGRYYYVASILDLEGTLTELYASHILAALL